MDAALLVLLNQIWTHPWLDWVMIGFSTAGLTILGGMTWWAFARGSRPLGRSLFIAQGAALVGTLLFYWLAARTRPDAARLILASPALPSFPSGHAAIAAATVTVWWLYRGWNRRTAVVVALAVCVAYSRVYLGHHYPTDVMAGAVLGAGMGAAVHGLVTYWGNMRAMVAWLLWPQIALVVMATCMAYLGLLPLHLLAWPYADKVLHLALFGSLAFWLHLWLPDWQLQMGHIKAPVAIVLPFVLVAVEEGLQSFSSLRTFDLGDLASDLVGLLLFYALSRWVMARMSPPDVLGSPLAQQDKIAR